MRQPAYLAFAFALIASLLLGCTSKVTSLDDALREANKTNIQRLTNLYGRFQFQNGGKGPKDQADLEAFIAKQDATFLKSLGVDPGNISSIFSSERDSQPFEVVYGVAGSSRGSDRAIVFEKTGVEGKRQVGFTSFAIRDYSNETEIAALKKGENQPTAPRPSGPVTPPKS